MPLPCLKPRRSSKVCPAPNSSLDVDLVEVRKGRMLRIQHINPRLRNKQVPQSKHGKTQAPAAPPLELHVPRVSFYGNKCVVTDAPSSNSNHVKNGGSGPSPNNNRTPAHVTGQNINVGRTVKSNFFPTNLTKEQKRMLFKMGVRSVSALKNIVLFFFHGVGGSSDIWQTQINYFSSLGFEIVAPDLIGHGMSEVPLKKKAYHFREILADVVAIFDRYCKKKNLVIGHSYGCAFTTVLARERARRVWRLIMISGGGPIPLAPEIGIFAFPLWFVSCIRPCLDQVFEKSAFKKKQKNEMLKRASFNIPSFVLHYVINGQDWPEGDEVYHSWISVPTLLINGREDTFATLDDAKLMKATIHGSKLEIVDEASHMVMLEAPEKVNKLILDFICSRGSHKLPDVKETAEEGQESPLKATPMCSYGGGGGGKPIHPNYLPQQFQHHHPHRTHEDRTRTPTQSPRTKTKPPRPETLPPLRTISGDCRKYTEKGEVDMHMAKCYGEETVAQGDSTPTRELSNNQQGSSYDNECYESDENGEEYYYYKDQYGNHHYVSASEYARQFPHSQRPPENYRSTDGEMEESTVEIPAFEDIYVEQQAEMDATLTKEETAPDYSYPVEINATHTVDLNSDGSPRYIASRKAHITESFDSSETSEVCESPCRSREIYAKEIDENLPLTFSVPELQFCEECIQKDNVEMPTDCKKCISINMAAAEYRNHQNSCTRRQSVTLALGRQRSDSLDYLGQEQLIIITCYDGAEEGETSISPSLGEDARNGIRRYSKEQLTNQRPIRHGQRTGAQEVEEVCQKPSLPTLSEQEEEYSPRVSPEVRAKETRRNVSPLPKQNTLNEDLVRSLHLELLAKVNKRNSMSEERKIPNIEKSKLETKAAIDSEPLSDESVIHRSSSFLESKKMMEAHFSKTAFKLPGLPSSGRSSPVERPLKKDPPKVLGAKPERPQKSPSLFRREQSEESVVTSSPSFLQSKRAIHEHFSKIGLSSPMSRPFSSPNLVSYGMGADNRSLSPQPGRKLSSSSSVLAKPEEALASDQEDSDVESPIARRLSVNEWAERHLKRVGVPVSPPKSNIEGTPDSSRAPSPISVSQSSSPASTPLSVSDWAERHLKRISVTTSPKRSPNITTSREDVSPKASPKKRDIVDEEEEEPRRSLSLNDWADRHLKLVASRLSSPPFVSEQTENKADTSSEKEATIPKDVDSLTLNKWAEKHIQKVAEIKTAESEVNVPKSPKPERGAVGREAERPQEPAIKALSLSEWAERHVRKIEEINTRSPKSLHMKLPNTESSPVRKEVSSRSPGKVTKSVGNISTNALNDWAEKHVRRISEQKLVAGPISEARLAEKDNNNKTEVKKIANVSLISLQTESPETEGRSQASPPNKWQSLNEDEKTSKTKGKNPSTPTKNISEDKTKESSRDVGKPDGAQINQETKSSQQTSFSNEPPVSRLPEIRVSCPSIDLDLPPVACLDILIESPEETSSLPSQTQVPQGHVQDNTDLDLLANSVAENDDNNNNNSDLRQASPNIQVTAPTFDDNSNVVASTSNSQDKDKTQASTGEQQSCCHKTADQDEPTDNDNNRIKSNSTSVTTTDTDTTTLSNVTNTTASSTSNLTTI